MRNFFKIIVYFFLFSLLVSCGKGFFKKVDTRKVPISGPERAIKNVKEGRGVGLGKMIRGGQVLLIMNLVHQPDVESNIRHFRFFTSFNCRLLWWYNYF